ncbi:MAG: NTP transferase domain-containing protein [Ignavibacteriae bacterium]|nr:NTP transferase domain-containing protein [Ignavibacteria bacterium]MBI3363506.1 NTP transferase domain-containing protein [Ignavibacteriota bacterium]
MRAIIPVAGFGRRLRPHTFTQPKVLLNVAGKPIIGHILDKIIEDGFDEATIIVGYLGEKIRDYILTHYKIKVDFVEQEEPKGLAHAIYLARATFTDQPLLIILGDTIFDVNLKPVLTQQYSAIGVKPVADPRRFGVVELEDGFAKKLVEKPEQPTSNLAIVGLYWIRNPKLLESCIQQLFEREKKTKGEYQLTDALQLMLQRGEKLRTFPVEGWYDCGKPETLLATNRHLLEKMNSQVKREGVVIVPPVFIAPNARITNSVIGPFATIANGAVIEDSIIRNSIVSEDAQVYKALLDDSLVGMNAVVQGEFNRINLGDSSEIEFH